MTIIAGIKKIFKRGKVAIITGIAVTGGVMIANAIRELLPATSSFIYAVLLGIGLIILAGWLGKKL
ncbi:MAG: hypothetical protein AABY22_02125 [Nanoarchaeota archaeon]